MAIRRAHPDIDRALDAGMNEVVVNGQPVNARLHLALHEVVATQLCDDDPPEVWATARRLVDEGFEHHEILHMLGSAMTGSLWGALQEERPYAHAEHVAALDALPGAWAAGRAPQRPPFAPPERASPLVAPGPASGAEEEPAAVSAAPVTAAWRHAWHTRTALVESLTATRRLEADGQGRWWIDGAPAPHLDGCLDN